MTDRDAAIERIRKLKALAAGNSNEHERAAALAAADKLAAKWKIHPDRTPPPRPKSVPLYPNGNRFDEMFGNIKRAYPSTDDSEYRSKGPGTYGKQDDG